MKKIISFFLVLFLLSCVTLGVSASSSQARIMDNGNLLTDSQMKDLNEKAEEISEKHHTDIRILTVDSIGSKSSQTYADDYFDSHGLGYGDDRSGILLLISMEYRDWAVTTNGEAHRIISYDDIGNIMDRVTDNLSDGNYYAAFSRYLDEVEKQLERGTTGLSLPVKLLIALGIGLLAAGIVLLIMRRSMRTARPQHGARSYITNSSYDLFRCHDIYLYSHTSKIRKQQNNSSSSGGSSRGGRSGKF